MSGFDLSADAAVRALASTRPEDSPEAARERYAIAVWCQLIEPGDSVAGRIIAARGPVAALEAVLAGGALPDVTPRELAEGRKRWLPRLSARAVASSLATAAMRGVALVTRRDPFWPGQLDDLGPHAPLCLWVRGDVAALRRFEASVAIVGARAASRYGDHVAMELAAELAAGGIAVVSGGAYGIDGAAHRATLATGGLTAALLAGGADRSYPAGHTQLIDDIAQSGVVASEVPCGSAPTKWRFLQRKMIYSQASFWSTYSAIRGYRLLMKWSQRAIASFSKSLRASMDSGRRSLEVSPSFGLNRRRICSMVRTPLDQDPPIGL